MRGRNKKDSDLNELQGNPGKRKGNNKQNFTASDKKFGIPKGLSKEVREKCRELAHYMEDRGCPIEFMRPMFERYCKHTEVAYKAFRIINGTTTGKGLTLKNRKNPNVQIFKDNSDAALKLEIEFKRILSETKPGKEQEDPLDEFLGKREIKRVK